MVEARLLFRGGTVCIAEDWSSQQAWEARVCIAEAHGVQGLPPSSSMMTQDGISALFMNAMNAFIVFLMDMNKLKLLYTAVQLVFYTNILIHGVWNRREIQLTRPALPYNIHALQTVLHLYKKYSEQVIVYAVIIHQTNISYSNEEPSAKHV